MESKTIFRRIGCSLILLRVVISCQCFSQQNFWVQTNGPYGGSVQAIVAKSSGEWFAGTGDMLDGQGGVFRSTDHGNTWVDASVGLTNRTVMSLAIDSTGTLFAGTSGGGVFRSTDNGDRWYSASAGITYPYIFSLGVTAPGVAFAGTNGGLFKSTNGGMAWSYLGFVQILAITLDRSGAIYTGSFGEGVRRSTDNGQTWTVLNSGLSNPHIRSLCVLENGWLYVGIAWGGVFRSTNRGNIWTDVRNEIGNRDVRSVAAMGSEVFAATTSGIFRSTNNGAVWISIGSEVSSTIASSREWPLIVGTTPNGILRSSDAGATWVWSRYGMSNTYVSALSVIDDRTIAAGIVGGVSVTTNGGESWEPLGSGLPSGKIFSLANNDSGTLLAGTSGSVYRRLAQSDTWMNVLNTGGNVRALHFARATGDFFASYYADLGGGIFRSTDGGTTWISSLDGSGGVFALTSSTNGHVFAGTFRGVGRTTDRGITWTPSGLQDVGPVSYLAATDNGTIYAGTSRGVYRSNDDGKTWNRWVLGLTDSSITSITVNSLGYVFAGTRSGVFKSTDAGGVWVNVSSGLGGQVIQSLAADVNGFVFAGTQGSGVFRSRQSTTSNSTSAQTIPTAFMLEQNYPNPFNPSTIIKYQLPIQSRVTIKIFNLLGQEVKTVVDGIENADEHQSQWDGRNNFGVGVASGVYFYRIEANGIGGTNLFRHVKKMLLLR